MPRPRSDIEPRIVDAARRRFLAEGVEASSLRHIARDAETSVGMVYYYFPTKDALFLAVVEGVYERLLRDFRAEVAGTATFRERLTKLFARYGALTTAEVEVLRLVTREVLTQGSRFPQLVERFRCEHAVLIQELLEEGVAAGHLEPGRSTALLTLCVLALGALPQIAARSLPDFAARADLPTGPALSAELVEILLHGVAAGATPRRASAPAIAPGDPP